MLEYTKTRIDEINAQVIGPDVPVVVVARKWEQVSGMTLGERIPQYVLGTRAVMAKASAEPFMISSTYLTLNAERFVLDVDKPATTQRPYQIITSEGPQSFIPHTPYDFTQTVLEMMPRKNDSGWFGRSDIFDHHYHRNLSVMNRPSVEFFAGKDKFNEGLAVLANDQIYGLDGEVLARLYRAAQLLGFEDAVDEPLATFAKDNIIKQESRVIDDFVAIEEVGNTFGRLSSDEPKLLADTPRMCGVLQNIVDLNLTNSRTLLGYRDAGGYANGVEFRYYLEDIEKGNEALFESLSPRITLHE